MNKECVNRTNKQMCKCEINRWVCLNKTLFFKIMILHCWSNIFMNALYHVHCFYIAVCLLCKVCLHSVLTSVWMKPAQSDRPQSHIIVFPLLSDTSSYFSYDCQQWWRTSETRHWCSLILQDAKCWNCLICWAAAACSSCCCMFSCVQSRTSVLRYFLLQAILTTTNYPPCEERSRGLQFNCIPYSYWPRWTWQLCQLLLYTLYCFPYYLSWCVYYCRGKMLWYKPDQAAIIFKLLETALHIRIE